MYYFKIISIEILFCFFLLFCIHVNGKYGIIINLHNVSGSFFSRMWEGCYGTNKLRVSTIYSSYRLVGKIYILKTMSWWMSQCKCTCAEWNIVSSFLGGGGRNCNCILRSFVGNATLRPGATLNQTFAVYLRYCRIVCYVDVQLGNGFWLKYIFVSSSNI